MVINRFIHSVRNPKYRFRLPRYKGNPVNWVIADRNRTRRRAKITCSHKKQVTDNTTISNITTTPQAFALCSSIDQGAEVYNRMSNHCFFRKMTLKGTIAWDQTGTPAGVLRVIVALVTKDFNVGASGLVPNSNIYGRNNFPDIRHVYYDKRFMNTDSNKLRAPIKIKTNFKGLPIRYNGPTGTTDLIGKDIYLIFVTNGATSTTDVSDVLRTTYWSEQ